MKVGIDKISFYTPRYFLPMSVLADARHEDVNKFIIGLGQKEMAVAPKTEDAITMATNAAEKILDKEDCETIELVIMATESGVDQSKAGAIYVHELLGINRFARAIEVKEACYGGTYALQAAVDFVTRYPEKKALVLASDIARYGLNTGGEVTQGAGAVAILVSSRPRIAFVDADSVYETRNIMDFWRPNYSKTAVVDGHYSNMQYLQSLTDLWERYKEKNNRTLQDFAAICFHLPYTKMGLKGLNVLLPEGNEQQKEALTEQFMASRYYNMRVGNIYTGSLYLSLISLLENSSQLKANHRIGMYSYGSGSVSEFFSLTLVDGFERRLLTDYHHTLLDEREALTIEAYEAYFKDDLVEDGSEVFYDNSEAVGCYRILGMSEHKRLYGRVN